MRINNFAVTLIVSIALHALVVSWVIKLYRESPPLFPKALDIVKIHLFVAPREIPPRLKDSKKRLFEAPLLVRPVNE